MKPGIHVARITDQSIIRKIAINNALSDCADSIVEDGFAFTPVEGKTMVGLIEFHKPPKGEVHLTLYVIDKAYGSEMCAEAFKAIMNKRVEEIGRDLRIEIQDNNRN